MAKVIFGMTISLDGFINDRNGSVARLYSDFAELRESQTLQESIRTTGAVVMGRRSYDMGEGDFTDYEFQTPIFVVTHHPPAQVAKGDNDKLSFTFVTDGVERAVELARAAAGEKDVAVIGGADIAQQSLRAGLIDELQMSIMPVLLGEGLRVFDQLGPEPIELEKVKLIESPTRTDIWFRVVK
jgi:dihydrofolate reductase